MLLSSQIIKKLKHMFIAHVVALCLDRKLESRMGGELSFFKKTELLVFLSLQKRFIKSGCNSQKACMNSCPFYDYQHFIDKFNSSPVVVEDNGLENKRP